MHRHGDTAITSSSDSHRPAEAGRVASRGERSKLKPGNSAPPRRRRRAEVDQPHVDRSVHRWRRITVPAVVGYPRAKASHGLAGVRLSGGLAPTEPGVEVPRPRGGASRHKAPQIASEPRWRRRVGRGAPGAFSASTSHRRAARAGSAKIAPVKRHRLHDRHSTAEILRQEQRLQGGAQ